MMIDNLQLEPLSVQFCGELMPQAHIDICSIFDISNHYLTVKRKAAQITHFGFRCTLEEMADLILAWTLASLVGLVVCSPFFWIRFKKGLA